MFASFCLCTKVANLAYKKNAWMTSDSSKHQKRHLLGSLSGSGGGGINADNYPLLESVRSRGSEPGHTARSSEVQSSQIQRTNGHVVMQARHRLGENSNGARNGVNGVVGHAAGVGEASDFWSLANQMMGDPGYTALGLELGDEMARRAVDGWTGEEAEEAEFEASGDASAGRTEMHRWAKSGVGSQAIMSDEPRQMGRSGRARFPSEAGEKSGQRHQCAILEYRWPFVTLPSWYVDLREEMTVNGVVIYTAGQGQSKLEGLDDKPEVVTQRAPGAVWWIGNLRRQDAHQPISNISDRADDDDENDETRSKLQRN
ncbi:unnamed protein product [Protopolystoma xenopodis]|uniref:Uncharacterized protein n=1 Tax=Protopolystoma xenopodis TaxID=117903 RepID=A0A3S5FC85_9PLAT|nr:unnamed protein product [Protopolystoma xenopodis]